MRALLVVLLAWLLGWLIACDAARPAVPSPAPVEKLVDAAPDAAISDAAVVDAAPPRPATLAKKPLPDNAAWKREVVALAAANGRYVAGWGTIMLDGTHPIRFASLAPHGYGDARGAYVLELARHHVVELTFYFDGRTSMFDGGDGVEQPPETVPWLESDAQELGHETGHHHGGEFLRLALRDGELVLLEYNYTDDVTDKSEQPIANKFPAGFACRPSCPLAATFHTYWGSQLAVSQPARSVGELREPPAPALPDAP
jgi:hypothetical protein